jgi:hypothetical protein
VDTDYSEWEEGHNRLREEENISTAAVLLTNNSSGFHDDLPVSNSFKFLMNVQLELILFPSLFWLCKYGWKRVQAAL